MEGELTVSFACRNHCEEAVLCSGPSLARAGSPASLLGAAWDGAGDTATREQHRNHLHLFGLGALHSLV